MDSRRRRLRAARSRRRSRRTGRVIVGSGHPAGTRQSAHWIRAKTAPTLESCTYTLVLVQKYAHEINIKATLRPLQKIYNYLCGPALEFSLKKKNWRISEIMPSVHAPPSTCEGNARVPFQWFRWFYSDWFWLLDYLWQSLYHLDVTNSFIDVSKFSDNTITSTTHRETMWAPLSIPILSGVILFLLPFNFSLNFLCSFSFWQFDWV